MTATQTLFERMADLDPEGRWEIYDGELREKPEMCFSHNDIAFELGYMLRSQLPRRDFVVRSDLGRIRQGDDSYFIPDVFVADRSTVSDPLDRSLEVHNAPLLLVVEIWSPSTGSYDLNEKLARYQLRRDHETWRLHPYERTLERWVLKANGEYDHSSVRSGIVHLAALPDVYVDLDALFTL